MLHQQTPLFLDHVLSARVQKTVQLKMECFQPSGSFKIRGIGRLCLQKYQEGTKGFLSSSGGNAGLAVAYSGKMLAVPTTIVVPSTTPEHVCERMRVLDARVLRYGDVWDESDQYARQYASKHSLSYIHPFDDPVIWSGHASLIQEVKKQSPKPDLIMCSVGGGGLLCGIMEGLYEQNWSDVKVIAVETFGASSLHASVQAGELVSIPAITSIAKSLGARQVSRKALDWAQKHPIHCVQVSDAQALEGCFALANRFRILVEPACGASYAALSTSFPMLQQAERILLIVCGGCGVDLELFREWKTMLHPAGEGPRPVNMVKK